MLTTCTDRSKVRFPIWLKISLTENFYFDRISTPYSGLPTYTIIDLCWGGHGALFNSKRHIDRRGAEVNMIKFTVQ